MSSCPSNDTPSTQSSKGYITIQQIEVYKIAALAIDAKGYRVCLRLKSNRGLAWSEIFVEEHELPIKLDEWKRALKPFVGRFEFGELTTLIAQANNLKAIDQRTIYLYTTALHQLKFMPEPKKQTVTNDEDVLKKRAVAYFSI